MAWININEQDMLKKIHYHYFSANAQRSDLH